MASTVAAGLESPVVVPAVKVVDATPFIVSALVGFTLPSVSPLKLTIPSGSCPPVRGAPVLSWFRSAVMVDVPPGDTELGEALTVSTIHGVTVTLPATLLLGSWFEPHQLLVASTVPLLLLIALPLGAVFPKNLLKCAVKVPGEILAIAPPALIAVLLSKLLPVTVKVPY